jgi:hypothetical protein
MSYAGPSFYSVLLEIQDAKQKVGQIKTNLNRLSGYEAQHAVIDLAAVWRTLDTAEQNVKSIQAKTAEAKRRLDAVAQELQSR